MSDNQESLLLPELPAPPTTILVSMGWAMLDYVQYNICFLRLQTAFVYPDGDQVKERIWVKVPVMRVKHGTSRGKEIINMDREDGALSSANGVQVVLGGTRGCPEGLKLLNAKPVSTKFSNALGSEIFSTSATSIDLADLVAGGTAIGLRIFKLRLGHHILGVSVTTAPSQKGNFWLLPSQFGYSTPLTCNALSCSRNSASTLAPGSV
ncbi:hypothetical protein C8J57DRAFT_1227647 [Mycena rebaudengoi]|nr:hypothetical protein C8J57DRAFT_1227647 [Mycena rebaudengoi]